VKRIVEDADSVFSGPAASEGIGYVGETIFVKGAGDEHAEHYRDGRSDKRRNDLREACCGAADRSSNESSSDRKPGH
jgi:hypothetical protein